MSDVINVAEDAAPILGEVKAGFAVAKLLLPVLAGVAGVGAVAGFMLWIHGLQADRDRWKAQAAQQHGVAAVATGQTAAAGDAAKIIDAGRAKADVTVHIQQENRSALLADPGAGQVIDPGLAADLSRRLCLYAAYHDDPGCADVRPADPGQLPQAGGGDAAPASPAYGWSSGRRLGRSDGPA